MADLTKNMKPTTEQIEYIASRLQWIPNKTTYKTLISLIITISIIILILLYLIIIINNLYCKLNKLIDYSNILSSEIIQVKNNQSSFKNNNGNNIRYLTSTSGKNTDNKNLYSKNNMPVFSNEQINPLLYQAVNGE